MRWQPAHQAGPTAPRQQKARHALLALVQLRCRLLAGGALALAAKAVIVQPEGAAFGHLKDLQSLTLRAVELGEGMQHGEHM